ncbi:MAG: LytTR family DNA-binding domain-containing protein, partial [Oscillospiraceae bacterium]
IDKGCLQTYTALDTLLAQLDSSFLRVQRSFIINMNFVESFLSDRVMLRDGTEIVLSRNNRGNLKKAYQQFLFDLARRNEP